MTKRFCILLTCALIFGSCKKEPDPPAPTPAPVVVPSSMTAKINGVSWTSSKNTGMLVIDTDNNMSALILNGETSNDVIALAVDLPTASKNLVVDNHDIGLTKDDALITYSKKTSGGGMITEDFPDEGTFNITSVDNANKKVSGNFSCKFHKSGSQAPADSLKITNGVFTNISFVIQ